jgi:ribonuclease D
MSHDPLQLVADNASLDAMVERALKTDAVAVDTESDSFYHYREKICLVQVSVSDAQGQTDYVIDPLASGVDLARMKPLLGGKSLKVFHDVGYDLLLCKKHLGVAPRPVFDTMLGLRMIGTKSFGLGAVLKERFQLELDKGLQRSDWSLRPLTRDQLEYAANDTRYLLPLAEQVARDLKAIGRYEWFLEDCERLLTKEPAEPRSEDDRFISTKGVKKLKGEMLAVARALFGLREHFASEWDKPPFRVFSNETLFALAAERPPDRRTLSRMKGLSHRVIQSCGERILAACAHPPPFDAPPRVQRTQDEVKKQQQIDERFEKLRERRKTVAAELNLDPEVVVSNATLWDFARAEAPDIEAHPDFRGWRRDVIGKKLVG